MREVNQAQARAISERAIATVKTGKLLAKPHGCPRQATALHTAILALQLVEEQHQPT